MSSFAENPVVGMILTLMLVAQLAGAAKPLVWNAYIRATLSCALIGASLLQAIVAMTLYASYRLSVPGEAHQGSSVRIVPFPEFVSLNVTMTSIYACGLVMMLVLAFGMIGSWVQDLAVDAAECLPFLRGGDHSARVVPDLRCKTPMK
jgi:hypothetical protein